MSHALRDHSVLVGYVQRVLAIKPRVAAYICMLSFVFGVNCKRRHMEFHSSRYSPEGIRMQLRPTCVATTYHVAECMQELPPAPRSELADIKTLLAPRRRMHDRRRMIKPESVDVKFVGQV